MGISKSEGGSGTVGATGTGDESTGAVVEGTGACSTCGIVEAEVLR